MSTIRVTINAPNAETAEQVKEQFFKKLYEHAGTTVIFEVPADAQDQADEIITHAKAKGCEGTSEPHEDPLEDAEPVDFW